MLMSDWSSDVCSSDLIVRAVLGVVEQADGPRLVRDLLERKRDPHTVARRRAPVIVKHERHAASPSPSASRAALRSSATLIIAVIGSASARPTTPNKVLARICAESVSAGGRSTVRLATIGITT